jgi:hypothetical protein
MSNDADFVIAGALVQSALRSLNQALRPAAKHGLVVEVELQNQHLQDGVHARIGTAL